MSTTGSEEKDLKITSRQFDSKVEGGDESLELTPQELRRLRRIVDLRILPYISFLSLLSFLDRVNIGQARLAGLEKDLKLKGNQFDIALTVFFVSYIVVDVPSNWAFKAFKPHRWVTFVMCSWSIITISMGLVHDFGGLVTTRFLLGVAEGGLAAGLGFMLTTWYKRDEQNWVISLFISGTTLAGAFGGILAFGIRHMAGIGGKDGWSWIFILEGVVTFVTAIPAWWLIPDFPEDGRVLRGIDQKRWLHRLQQDQGVTNASIPFSMKQVSVGFVDWKTYVYSLMCLGVGQSLYSLALFTPSIIKGIGYTNANSNLLSVPPYAFGFLVSLGIAWWSDRTLQRGVFVIGCMLMCIVGYVIQLTGAPPTVKYIGIFLCVGGVSPCIPTTIAWVGNNYGPAYTRATVMGFVFSMATIAGIISSNVYPPHTAPRYFRGHSIAIGFACLAIICSATLTVANRIENARRDTLYGPVAPGGSDINPNEDLSPEQLRAWGLEGLSQTQIIELGDRHPAFRYVV